MRVAIIHYHLRPGGVTQVIRNALAALAETGVQAVVFSGEPPSPTMPVKPCAVLDALGYHDTASQHSPEDTVKDLISTAKQQLGGMPDVWHIHNHALGKNLILPEVVYLLARQGQRLLLQIHDFAEDLRADNYKFLRDYLCPEEPEQLGARLYPQGSHIHYALLNQRDLAFLKAAGGQPEQFHHLPNAVSMEDGKATEMPQEKTFHGKLYFYPVRAIRRKNIGELLFWSAIATEEGHFAIARAPQNPVALPIYDDWVKFAQSLRLPVEFGLGETWKGEFSQLLSSASALVTTSVAEGFGLAFLEPWFVKRPLIGRKLPEITDEFEDRGIDLSTLYTRLDIPVEWVGRDHVHHAVQTALAKVYDAYERRGRPDDVERAVHAAISGEYVDFGRLNEPLQKMVIEHLMQTSSARNEISTHLLPKQKDHQDEIIERNYTVVMEQYNLKKYQERLLSLYHTVAESETGSLRELNATVLLDQFLASERFCLLRT